MSYKKIAPNFLYIALCCLLSSCHCASKPNDQTQEPCADVMGLCSDAKTSMEDKFQKRLCPHQYPMKDAISSFSGTPCDENSDPKSCIQYCQAITVPTKVDEAGADFFNECEKAEVLCVGQGRAVADLEEAAKIVNGSSVITKILIDKGIYRNKDGGKPITFENIKREIILEGKSNDPKDGSRIEAIEPTSEADDTYAALRLIDVQGITIRRLVFSGQGHGLYVRNTRFIGVTNNHYTNNLRTGAILLNVSEKVRVENNHFIENGSRLKTVGKTPHATENHFGLVIQSTEEIIIQNNEISRNGAGGILLGPDVVAIGVTNNHRQAISVEIDGDHRIISDDQISIGVTNNHRVGIKNNLIYRNGPLGRANSAETIANATPSVPLLWSNDRYEVIPTDQIDKTKNKIDAVLGIGVVLGGVGKAEISGNSFIFNDVMSLIVVSVDDLIFRENVIERNGFHQNLDKVQLYKYSFSAMRSWNISKSFALQYNLIIDNVQNGIEIVHPQNQKNRLKIDIKGNHFGGNGQVLKDLPLPMGKGLVLDALADSGGLDIQAEYNYYAQNRLIGLYAYGNVSGRFTNNLLINNQGTPILFVDDSTKQDKLDPASLPTMVIGNNELNNGRGVGIRFYGNANVRPYIGSNSVVDLQTVQTNPAKENGKIIQTADAINITKVASGEVIIRNNKLIDNQRAGIFVEKANVKVENNTIKNSDYLIVQGEQANITGSDSSLAVVPKEKLENEPPLR